jgi:lycopene beta-cyclase
MATTIERVDIPMGGPLPDRSTRLLAFGAAAGMIHPATGHSLTTSLERADPVAAAIVTELDRPTPAHRRVWDTMWPPSMRRSRLLHEYGLDVLLTLDDVDTRSFFSAFFELDRGDWAAYLRVTTSPRRLARVMSSMFRAAPWRLRRRLVSRNPLAFVRLLRPR